MGSNRRRIRVDVVKDKRQKNFILKYRDPFTGQPRQCTSTVEKRESLRPRARREAAELALQLEAELNSTGGMPWHQFEDLYKRKHLCHLDEDSQKQWSVVSNHIARYLKPQRIGDMDRAALQRLVDGLMLRQLSDASVKSYLQALKAALNWAVGQEYLDSAPKYQIPGRRQRQSKVMRGKPIKGEQLDRMLAAVHKVRPGAVKRWQIFLEGLYLSGLRLSEALAISWDWEAEFSVVLDGRHSHYRIFHDKSREDRLLAIVPEFVEFLEKHFPEKKRHGLIFNLPITMNYASATISDIGEEAGVVTGRNGETATAHDLRRSFGTRWAPKVMPAVLKNLMRHSDIATTMKYYVDIDMRDISQQLWDTVDIGGKVGGSGLTPSNGRIANDPLNSRTQNSF